MRLRSPRLDGARAAAAARRSGVHDNLDQREDDVQGLVAHDGNLYENIA